MENVFLLQHSCFFLFNKSIRKKDANTVENDSRHGYIGVDMVARDQERVKSIKAAELLEQKESDKRAGHEMIKIRCDASEH